MSIKSLVGLFVVLIFAPVHLQAALVSQNLGAGAYSASKEWFNGAILFDASLAFDGNFTTGWNSGDWTTSRCRVTDISCVLSTGNPPSDPEWIEVDLGQSYDISEINLVVGQAPTNTYTEHQIWLSSSSMGSNLAGATLAQQINGVTNHNQVLMAALAAPISAQFVQIRTVLSQSWIAWFEVQVFSVSEVPIPAAVWLFGTALVGLVGFSKRRKATG